MEYYVDSRLARAADQAGPQSAAAPASPLDDLKKLGELRTAGVLTEAEFASKKAAILARL